MKKDERSQIGLDWFRGRYRRSDRKDKTKLLNELCDLYAYNRKYLVQYFRGLTGKKYLPPGRKKVYVAKVLLEPLKRIWLATDQMCGKRLKAAIPLWLPFYEEPLTESQKKQLLSMGAATIDRLLKPCKLKYKRRGLTGTKPGYLLKNQILIKTDHWDVNKPGFIEADTVAHCGNSMAGDFVWSITLTDIATSWTENRAVWNKGSIGVLKEIQEVEESLDFPMLGIDFDNGSEFLNWHETCQLNCV